MLRKTILELNQNLSNKEQRYEMLCQVAAALEEIKNYKINYVLYDEDISIAQEKEEIEDIKESLKEILDFVNGAENAINN